MLFAGKIYVDHGAMGSNNGADWANAFTNLQSALTSAVYNDSILVASGTYTPHASDTTISFSLKDSVSIFGGFAGTEDISTFDFSTRDFSANETILSGDLLGNDVDFTNTQDNSCHVVSIINVDSSGVLNGFTIQNGHGEGVSPYRYGGGIYMSSSTPLLQNLLFKENYAQYNGSAIYATNSSVLNLENAEIINNKITYYGAAFYVTGSEIHLKNVFIANNTAGYTGAAGYVVSSSGEIVSSTIVGNTCDNSSYGNINIGTGSSVEIINTIIYENDGDIQFSGDTLSFSHSIVQNSGGSSNWLLTDYGNAGGNIDANPLFVDYSVSADLYDKSPALGAGDIAYSSNIGVYAGSGTYLAEYIYVDINATGSNDGSSWTNAYTNLQTAVDNAIPSQTVCVAKGTYIPHESDTAISFTFKNDITVLGGFAGDEAEINQTIIDSRDFVTNETILSGDLLGNDVGFTNNSDNSCHVVYVSAVDSSLTIDGFTISNGYSRGSTLDDQRGAGIFMTSSSAVFKNILLQNNYANRDGAGMYATNASIVKLQNAIVRNNECVFYGGGICLSDADADMENVFVSGNVAKSYGGGLYLYNVDGKIVNTTITNNDATSYTTKGGVYLENSSLQFINSLIAENEGDVFNDGGGSPTFSYSLIPNSGGSTAWTLANCTDGGNNIDSLAFFVDNSVSDTLYDASPAIGTGNASYGVNIGSFQGSGVPYPEYVFVKVDATGNNDGTSWENAYTSLQTAINNAPVLQKICVAKGKYTPHSSDRSVSFTLKKNITVYGGFAGDEAPMDQSVIDARDIDDNETILSGDLNGDDNGFTNNSENSYHVLYVEALDTTAIIDGVTISGGNANGTGNDDSGGGVFLFASTTSSNAVVMNNVKIANNFANEGAGIFCNYSYFRLSNSLVYNNLAQSKGAFANFYNDAVSSTVISNTTIYNNQSESSNAASLYNWISDIELVNTIMWNNAMYLSRAIYNANTVPSIKNCNIENTITDGIFSTQVGIDEGGNIMEESSFVNPDAGDYSVYEDSPVLNAGDSNFGVNIGKYQGSGVLLPVVIVGVDTLEFGATIITQKSSELSFRYVGSNLQDSILVIVQGACNIGAESNVWSSNDTLIYKPEGSSYDTLVYVQFDPQTLDDTIGYVIIQSRKAVSDTLTVVGKAVEPEIVLSIESIDFGNVIISDTSSAEKIVITGSNLIDTLKIVSSEGFLFTKTPDNENSYNDTLFLIPSNNSISDSIYVRVFATSASISNGIILFSSLLASDIQTNVSANITTPAFISSTTNLGFGTVLTDTISNEESFSFEGTDLLSDAMLIAPNGFKISLLPGDNFIGNDTIIVSPVNDTIASAMVYVKFLPSSENVYTGTIKIVSDSAQTLEIAVAGTGQMPPSELYVPDTTFNFGTIGLGIPSEVSSYQLVGKYIDDNISILAPSGYEISFVSDDFSSATNNLNIAFTNTAVDTTIFVRFAPTSTLQSGLTAIYHSSSEVFDLELPVTAVAEAPSLSVSTNTVNFGDLLLTDTAQAQEILVNAKHILDSIVIVVNSEFSLSSTPDIEESYNDTIVFHPDNTIVDTSFFVRTIGERLTTLGMVQVQNNTVGDEYINLSVNVLVPSITITNKNIDFGNIEINTASVENTFTISGSNLLSDVVIEASEGYTISLEGGSSFSSDTILTIPIVDNALAQTDIYVVFNPSAVKSYSTTLSVASDSIVAETVSVIGTGILPVPKISTSHTALDFYNVEVGKISSSLGFKIYAEDLQSSLTLIAPANFEISLSPSAGFASEISIPQSGGIIDTTNIYAIFFPDVEGGYSENIEIITTDYTGTMGVVGSGIIVGNPLVTLSPAFIDFGSVIIGDTSNVLQFSVEGSNLQSDITMIANANVEMSLDGSNFTSDFITISHMNGIVSGTKLYARFVPEIEGNIVSSITSVSINASKKEVLCYGTGIVEPIHTVFANDYNFGEVIAGEVSIPQSFIYEGHNLTGSVEINCDYGFKVSKYSFSGFVSSLSLTPSSGTISQKIYVQFAPVTSGEISGNIVLSSSDFENDTLLATGIGIIRPKRFYVNATATGNETGLDWENAYSSLSTSLANVVAFDTLFVAKGVYTPHESDRNESFRIPSKVKVYGGFEGTEVVDAALIASRDWKANATILSGDLLGDDSGGNKTDNSYHVVVFNSELESYTTATLLDGVYISNGYADGTAGGFYTYYAGGIVLKGAYKKTCSPSLQNIIVENNYGKAFGGGLAIFPSTTDGVCNPVIENAIFRNNTTDQDGGALYIGGSVADVAPLFTNVEFYGNSARNGGAIYNKAACEATCAPVYTNVIICGNSADMYGGAVYNISTDEGGSCAGFGGNCMPTFINATITNNVTSTSNGNVCNSKVLGLCDVTYINTIVWGNTNTDFTTTGANVSIANSIVAGTGGSSAWNATLGTDGGSNVDEDPLFVAVSDCDVRLLLGSKALGNGNITYGNNSGYYQEAGLDAPPLLYMQASLPPFGDVPIGSSSLVKQFTIEGDDLIGDVTVSVPNGFEISTSSSTGFDGITSLVFTPISGVLVSTPVYIRLVPTEEKAYTGHIHVSSQDALSKAYSISGTGKIFNPYIYVKANAIGNNDGSSWDDAYTDLQAALANYESSKQILVAKGKYKPHTSTRTVSFYINDGIKIYGGFEGTEEIINQEVLDARDFELNETILSGDLAGNDVGRTNNAENSYHVVMMYANSQSITNATILDGFTIEGGNANDFSVGYDGVGQGAGIYICGEYSKNVAPVLKNLIVRNNSSYINGGGIAITLTSSNSIANPTLENILFENNTSQNGGGLALGSGFSTNATQASNLVFKNNSATLEGGALYISSLCNGVTEPYFENVLICSNSAKDGSAIANVSGAADGCSTGGGACIPTLVNVTITNNSGYKAEPIFSYVEEGACNPSFINALIWGNVGYDTAVVNRTGAFPSFQNCLIEGSGGSLNWLGEIGQNNANNIDVNPLFVDKSSCTGELKSLSEALNAGNSTYGNNIGYYQGIGIDVPPSMEISESVIIFGDVFLTETFPIQSFVVSGTDLQSDIVITAPTVGFEISTDGGIGFTPEASITLVPESGIVSPVTIYVRFSPTESKAYTDTIIISNSELNNIKVVLSGYGISEFDPTISLNQTHLEVSRTYVGGKSYVQGFTVSGTNITDSIVVSSPSFIKISTDAESFTDTAVVFHQNNGFAGGTVYFQFQPTEVGLFDDYIVVSSSGAVTKSLLLTGEAVAEPSVSISSTQINFPATEVNSYSNDTIVTFEATGLINDVVVVIPPDFEAQNPTNWEFATSKVTYYETNGIVSVKMRLRFTPLSAGIKTGSFIVKGGESELARITVSGKATGKPGISKLDQVQICEDVDSIGISFQVTDDDISTTIVEATLDNNLFVTIGNVEVLGTGEDKILSLSGISGYGTCTVSLLATDIDGNQTSATAYVTIIKTPKFELSLFSDMGCNPEPVVPQVEFYVTESTGSYQIFLDGKQTADMFTYNIPNVGYHTFLVLDETYGCANDTMFLLEQAQPFSAEVFDLIHDVNGHKGSVEFNINGGIEPYHIDNNGENIVYANKVENLDQGVYYMVVMDDQGCSVGLNIVIEGDGTKIDNEDGVKVYPTLFSNMLIVEAGNVNNGIIQLLNIDGKQIQSEKTEKYVRFETSQLAAGSYKIRIISQGTVIFEALLEKAK